MPQLTVVMPVHNALPFLDVAVESILAQTFGDFEFLILDDASTDGSTERLREWASRDKRIRLLEVRENLGPAISSQHVARAASTPIVARMDADDVSLPDRLKQQFEVLDQHPEVGVVGCLSDLIDASDRQIRAAEPWRLARSSRMVPFAHGAIMYRRMTFDQVGGYREECIFWEDQDVVTRMAAVSDVLVIPRVLYRVRQSALSTRFTSGQDDLERALDLLYRCLDRLNRGEGYDDLLAKPSPDGKIDPRSYISLGSVILWAGRRPRLLGRLLTRGRLSLNFASLSAIVWTSWAFLSPESLRPFLLLMVRLRSVLAKAPTEDSKPIYWPLRADASSRPSLRGVESTSRRASGPSAGTG